jgi:hypothetical protein
MKMRIENLEEPDLEFGQGAVGKNPRTVLPHNGPLSSTYEEGVKTFQLGLVALPSEVTAVRDWVRRMHQPLLTPESNAMRFAEFPGVGPAFHCRFEIPQHFVRELNADRVAIALVRSPQDRFEELLKLYSDKITSLFTDPHPDCILVCFPEDVATLRITNPRLTLKERLVLERLQQEDEVVQQSLFEPTADEKRIAAELLPQAEELLFRNFHRALKAKCMMESNPVPLQVLRRHTYISTEAKQSDATRAWNLSTALYYKASKIPWRPRDLTAETCFVGVTFHHLKRRAGDLVYASLAQAFSNTYEPFALKGASIPRDQSRNKQPYLTEDQAAELMRGVVTEYENMAGSLPTRVVVHKTSRYQPEEERGFRNGLLSEVAACELVWLAPTGFRLLRRGTTEPFRGTLCTVEDRHHYLFTTGYVPWWAEYPGPHIPAPLEIGVSNGRDVAERAREILALTKMNWNSADGIGRHPITLSFARRVGTVMTEMSEDATPNPRYRFYM